jgi:hypothetical protein
MKGEFMSMFTLTALSIGALLSGLHVFFGYDIIGQIIPEYAKWVYGGIAVLGGWTLYGLYSRK